MIKILLLITLLVILFIYIYFTRSIENYDSSVTVLNTSSLIHHLKTTIPQNPLLTTDTNNVIIHIDSIPNTFNNVTTLNLQNNNLSMLDYQNTLRNLPSLQVFDISNNNNFIGFQENSFSNNNSLQRIVINNPSFYINSGKKLYISIDQDTNNLPNLTKDNIHRHLGIPNNAYISYYNTSQPQTTSSQNINVGQQGQGQGQDQIQTTSSQNINVGQQGQGQGEDQIQTTSSQNINVGQQGQGQGQDQIQTTSSQNIVLDPPQVQTTSSQNIVLDPPQVQTTSSQNIVLDPPQVQTTSSQNIVLDPPQVQTTSSQNIVLDPPQVQTTSSQNIVIDPPQVQTTSSQNIVLDPPQVQTTSSQNIVLDPPQVQTTSSQNIVIDPPQVQTTSSQNIVIDPPQVQTTSSQDMGSYIPNCSLFTQREQCNDQNHCVFNINTGICNNICTNVQESQCGALDHDTRNICRVNCGLCEVDDGSPTRSVCSVDDCNLYNGNNIQNCPSNLCNAIMSNAGNLCIPKPCRDLNQESCELLRNNDGTQRCIFQDGTCNTISGFKNYEHFQSSQYVDLTDNEYLQIFQFVRKSDLINGINLNIEKCVSESNCNNNKECITYENNCKSCYKILKDYYSTFYKYDYYNNQANIYSVSPRLDDQRTHYINLRDNELTQRRLLKELLISKNILDSNGGIVNQSLDNLDVNDDCYELKKLLTQNNLTCSKVENDLRNIVENCTSNIQGCTIQNFECSINNNLRNNSINYCLPYNMSSNQLELNHRQNKMINMLRKYPVSDCYDNFIYDSKL